MIVHVYKNLHKDCWSVRRNGKVIEHTKTIVLKDATFHVQPAGQRKVRETGVKNVHAYIRGTVVKDFFPPGWMEPVGYDPKVDDTFINKVDNTEIHKADFVMMLYPGVFVK